MKPAFSKDYRVASSASNLVPSSRGSTVEEVFIYQASNFKSSSLSLVSSLLPDNALSPQSRTRGVIVDAVEDDGQAIISIDSVDPVVHKLVRRR